MYYFVPLVVFRRPIALISHPCPLPVAILSRKKTLLLSYHSSVALLLLSCRFPLSLPCRFALAVSPGALLSTSICFPVDHLIARSCFLLFCCGLPGATLSTPCRPPVALLLQLPCLLPVACLSLPLAFLPGSCGFPVDFLVSACPLLVAIMLPSWLSLLHMTVACFALPESIQNECTEAWQLQDATMRWMKKCSPLTYPAAGDERCGVPEV